MIISTLPYTLKGIVSIHEGVNADGLYLAVPMTNVWDMNELMITVKSVAVIYSRPVHRCSMKIIIVLLKPPKCCLIENEGIRERTVSTSKSV